MDKEDSPARRKAVFFEAQSEARTAALASLSSLLATVRRACLPGHPLPGHELRHRGVRRRSWSEGSPNFLLNRYWTFRASARPLLGQTILYVAGSVLTFLVLRTALWVLVEKAGVRERVAWFPAKAMAWVVMALSLSTLGRVLPSQAMRFVRHVQLLWPSRPLLPILPFWAWVVFWGLRHELRWEHVAMAPCCRPSLTPRFGPGTST